MNSPLVPVTKMSDESGTGKDRKEPLREIKKRLENKTSSKVTPVKGKKLKLKNKKFKKLQKIDRSRTPNKQIADADEDPGTGTSCPLCGKQFPKNGPMRRHFEDIHQPGEYPCPGEGCGKVGFLDFLNSNQTLCRFSHQRTR